jgi:hypothetical protein
MYKTIHESIMLAEKANGFEPKNAAAAYSIELQNVTNHEESRARAIKTPPAG